MMRNKGEVSREKTWFKPPSPHLERYLFSTYHSKAIPLLHLCLCSCEILFLRYGFCLVGQNTG